MILATVSISCVCCQNRFEGLGFDDVREKVGATLYYGEGDDMCMAAWVYVFLHMSLLPKRKVYVSTHSIPRDVVYISYHV